jgi:hypothetical protein
VRERLPGGFWYPQAAPGDYFGGNRAGEVRDEATRVLQKIIDRIVI